MKYRSEIGEQNEKTNEERNLHPSSFPVVASWSFIAFEF